MGARPVDDATVAGGCYTPLHGCGKQQQGHAADNKRWNCMCCTFLDITA